MSSIKLSICIPICNTDNPPAHYTGNCIGSIKYFTDLEYEIIVIDNASTVTLGGLIWEDVVDKYVCNDENLGVAKSWNQGIKEATGDYIAILNSDVQVFDSWDRQMVQSLEHVDLVMATPMYDKPYGRAQESCRYVADLNPDKHLKDFTDFSCFMFKRDLIDKVGYFDENYGLGYGEDVDFKLRMEKLGLVAKSDSRVATHHVGMATGTSLGKQGINFADIMDQNKQYTKEKHKLDEYGIPEFKKVHDNDLPQLQKKEYLGSVVRTDRSGDKVYYINENDEVCWVMNPETLSVLGFGFGDVQTITQEEFNQYEPGDKLDLREQYIANQPKEVQKEVDEILGYAKHA